MAVLIAMGMMVPFIGSSSSASAQTAPIGVVVRDVTATSDCKIERARHATPDPSSEVIESRSEECPFGSVVETIPVWNAEEAAVLDGVFVEFTGDYVADLTAVENTKSSVGLPVGPVSTNQALACVEGGWSAYMEFWANEPGLTVWSYVYYWEDFACNSGISSTLLGINPSGQQRFAKSKYNGADYHHGCGLISTGGTWYGIHQSAPLGYLFVNETRSGTKLACDTAWSQSHTGSVYLYKY